MMELLSISGKHRYMLHACCLWVWSSFYISELLEERPTQRDTSATLKAKVLYRSCVNTSMYAWAVFTKTIQPYLAICLSLACHYLGLACHYLGLACHYLGLTCHYLGLACHYLGLAFHYLGLACHYLDLACHYLGLACHYLDLACHYQGLACHYLDLACHYLSQACHYLGQACHYLGQACICSFVRVMLSYTSIKVYSM